MSTWTVRSRIEPDRWVTWTDGKLSGDTETLDRLTTPGAGYMVTPTGPARYIETESDQYAAAMWIIPAPADSGDVPPYPELPPTIPGAVY